MFSEPHNSHGQLEYCIAAMLTTTLVLCCRKQRSKVSLTNVTHQPHALHPPIPAHRLPKRVVVGLARETADEDRAVGVAGGLGVAERVI